MINKIMLSIVVPIYQIAKRFELLRQALESIANQTYEKLEIIIIDDGSTDDTADLVNAFIGSDDWKYCSRTKLIIIPINSGVSIARNIGAQHASGELISFFDWDDLLLPQYAEKVINTFSTNPGLSVVLPQGLFYAKYDGHEKARLLDVPSNINTINFHELIVYILENNFPAPMGSGICVKAQIFNENKIKFDEFLSKKTAEDILFGYQLLEANIRPYFILGDPLILIRAYLNIASRGRGAVLKDFEFDSFLYIRKNCTYALIERIREISELDYLRLKDKHDITQATFQIKKNILGFGLWSALAISWKSAYLMKKFIYYTLFLRIDPLFNGGLYQSYSFYKTKNQSQQLILARSFLSKF